MQKMSFTVRLLFWITLVGVLPLAVVGLYTHDAFYDATRDSAKNYLTSSLRARSVHLRDWMRGVERDLLFVAKSNCVLGLCDKDHVDREGGECPFLSAVLLSHPAYRYLVGYDTEGNVISRRGERPGCWPAETEHETGGEALQAAGFFMSPHYCRDGDHTLITVARPVFREREMTGAYILAALDFNEAVQAAGGAVREPRPGEKFYIVDGEGRFVLPPEGHSDLWGSRSVSAASGAGPGSSGAVGEYGDFRGVEVLGAMEPVRGTAWRLVAEIENEVAFRWARQVSLKAGTVLFVSLALLLAVSYIMAHRLSLPVRRLAGAAVGISEGRKWQKLPPFKGREASQVGRAFNDMLDSLREKQEELARTSTLAGLGEFTSITVHEMRGPLASIKLNLQGLKGRCGDGSDNGTMAGLALEQVERLEIFLQNMLNLGKPLRLEKEACSFASLMKDVQRTVAGEMDELEVTLDITEGSGEVTFQADGELMNQAISNLVQNAAEWSGRHGTVTAAAAAHPQRKGWVRVTITDSGPGIMAGEEEKIFQPFYSTRNGGTGLGLAHAKKIVEYHGGTLRATAGQSGGAVLTLDLPEAT